MLRNTPDGTQLVCEYCRQLFPLPAKGDPWGSLGEHFDDHYCPNANCPSNSPEARRSFAQTLAALAAETIGTQKYHRGSDDGGYMACLDDVIELAHYFEEESRRATLRHPGKVYWDEVGDWYVAIDEAARRLAEGAWDRVNPPTGDDLYAIVVEAFSKSERVVAGPPRP